MIKVETIPILEDNFSYLLCDQETGKTAIVDPSEAETILDYLDGAKLDYILNTHHHYDHTGGNLKLKEITGAKIVGYAEDKERIPGIDITISNTFTLGSSAAEIITTPGHTIGHIAILFEKNHLFCGDTLFIAGCGKLFEGTAEQMLTSLNKLKKLPNDTLVYCGHEYTIKNLLFALSLEPDNPDLLNSLNLAKKKVDSLTPTVPSIINLEKRINPFLRTNDRRLKLKLKMENAPEVEVLVKLRQLKESF